MTTYVFPAIAPNTIDTQVLANTKVFSSPLSGHTQTAARNGTRLRLSQRFANLEGDNRRIMQAFLARLKGQTHRALVYDHSYHGARGALGGSPVINGANQTGVMLDIRGMTADVSNIFMPGDQISFPNGNGNYELKMIMDAASSDALGHVTVEVSPEIHVSPADGVGIITTKPPGTFMLATPDVKWSNRPDGGIPDDPIQSDFNIDWLEDIS